MFVIKRQTIFKIVNYFYTSWFSRSIPIVILNPAIFKIYKIKSSSLYTYSVLHTKKKFFLTKTNQRLPKKSKGYGQTQLYNQSTAYFLP